MACMPIPTVRTLKSYFLPTLLMRNQPQIVDLACGERLPERVLTALEDPAITKAAFNAQFERTCISKYLERRLSPSGWQCTAVQSAMLALPLSLDSVGEVLNIQRKKLKEGVDLVRFFSMPCKPTKANGGRHEIVRRMRRKKWERFKTYCIRDVDAEREIRQKLWKFPIPEAEMELYRMDQEINDRGILWISSWWRMRFFVTTSIGKWSRQERMN